MNLRKDILETMGDNFEKLILTYGLDDFIIAEWLEYAKNSGGYDEFMRRYNKYSTGLAKRLFKS